MTKEKKNWIMKAYKKHAKDIQLEEVEVEKNNRQILTGMRVGTENGSLGIVIYWDDLERIVGENAAMDKYISCIDEMVKRHLVMSAFNEDIYDWKKMKSRVRKKVVNYKLNSGRLKDVVYREYLDLAEVLYITLLMPGGQGSCEVQKLFLGYWEVSEEELFRCAEENMESEQYEIRNLTDVLGENFVDQEEINTPMLFATNKEMTYGAALVTNPKLLKTLLGEQDGNYYILPSSIHEIILYSDDAVTVEELQTLVHEVNWTSVSKTDFLSDSVYYYCSDLETVTICE